MVFRWAYTMHNAGYQSKSNSEFLTILVQQVVSVTMNMYVFHIYSLQLKLISLSGSLKSYT